MHVTLLTSGRVFGSAQGGEDRFTNSFGYWLAKNHHDTTLIGIDYAGMKVRHLTHKTVTGHLPGNQTKKPVKKKFGFGLVLAFRYLSYSLRSIIWMFQVLTILLINLRCRITLIHAQDSGYTGLAAVVAAKTLGIPVIISLHGIRYKEIESNPFLNKTIKKIVLIWEKKLDRFTLKNADLVSVVSPSMINYVNQVTPLKEVEVLPVAIRTMNFQYSKTNRDLVRSQLGIDSDAKVLGFVGRLSYEKNLFNLLESFAEVSKNDPFLVLILVGNGPLQYELRKKVEKLNIQNKVIFCGVREDIGSVLSSFDIFVLPSTIEGLSNALLEAMASGRAIICSDIIGNRQLITNNVDGLLIDPEDTKSIISCIQLLSKDEALRHSLGENAMTKIHQYDEETVFPKILQFYKRLLG